MLQAGFSRIDITPPLGTHLAGNFRNRPAEGARDPLLATCIAFRDGEGSTALIYSIDNLYLMQSVADVTRKVVSEMTGVPEDAVFLACTHIHTGPCMVTKIFPHNPVYNEWFHRQMGTLGAEDFSDYLAIAPGAFIRVGTGGGIDAHHPRFTADPKALLPAARFFAALAEAELHHLKGKC